MKKGFTLLEVNLAIFVMATGVLGMCGLYSLGFRENRQSVEDVASAAFADAYLGPLVQGLSATNMTWNSWVRIGDQSKSEQRKKGVADGVWPKNGWLDYVQKVGNAGDYRVMQTNAKADGVFQQVLGQIQSPYRGTKPDIPSGFHYALVVTRRGATVQLAFRCARRKEGLMGQPIYVSEVRFQGVVE